MKYYKTLLITILILFIFSLSIQAVNYGGELKLKFQQLPIELNPIYAANETEQIITRQIFDSLVELNEKGELTAHLAESWEIEEEGRLFTFKLREEVYFHPYQIAGEPVPLSARRVKAEDWKWSFEYLASPENKSPYAQLFSKVKGYDDYRQGESGEITGIRVLDNYQLQIELTDSYAPFIYNLTKTAAAVMPKNAVLNKDNFSIIPIGTGAFKISDFTKAQVNLVKNNNYWKNNYQDEVLPYLEQIQINFSTKSEEKGDYQQYDIYQLNAESYRYFRDNKIHDDYQLKKIPQDIYYFLTYNYSGSKQFNSNSPGIRSSIRSNLNKIDFKEVDSLNLMLPISNNDQESYLQRIYKLTQENEVENYKLEDNIKEINLISSDSKNSTLITELIRSKLQTDELTVNLKKYNWAEYLNLINDSFKAELFLMTYKYHNKFDFLADNFYSESELNYSSYNNQRVDNLIDYLKLVNSLESRRQAYQIIEDILANDNPFVFVLQGAEARIFSNRVAGQDLFTNIYLKDNYELIYLK